MARLDERLADAEAALDTLKELADRDHLSLAERDGAILRLVYTFEAVWKTAALFLETREGIEARSPKGTIRASRQVGLLDDEDAEIAIGIADDRNLTVHMYKQEIGNTIADRLASHAAILEKWLMALRQRSMEDQDSIPSTTYRLFEKAMIERKQIICVYDNYRREVCPIILGHTQGEERALTFQFSGGSTSNLPREGDWRCLVLSNVSEVELRVGPWYSGRSHKQPSGCVEVVDLDVNTNSPYNPKRRLAAMPARKPVGPPTAAQTPKRRPARRAPQK